MTRILGAVVVLSWLLPTTASFSEVLVTPAIDAMECVVIMLQLKDAMQDPKQKAKAGVLYKQMDAEARKMWGKTYPWEPYDSWIKKRLVAYVEVTTQPEVLAAFYLDACEGKETPW